MVASLFVDSLRFIPDNAGLLLHKAAGLAVLAFTALGIALLIALPLGLWLGHRHRGLFFALGTSSIGRAMPSIALIGVFIALLGVGFWNTAVALVILAVPPILTNAYVAVDGVDRDVVEAARGMGLTERQILAQVELPLGLPLVLTGIRIAAVFVIATATLAGIAGQPGHVRGVRRPRRCVLRCRDSASDGVRAVPRTARGLAQTGSQGVGSRGGQARSGQTREEE